MLKQLPEFHQLRPKEYYEEKLQDQESLILIATSNETPVACKVGYDRFHDGSFYSWLGGVLPAYRKSGIARDLAHKQQEWARNNKYQSIRLKTMNKHKAMLIFALGDGFEIFNIKVKDELENYRIELIKYLR